MTKKSISRRGLVKAGLGAGAAGLLLRQTSLPVFAQANQALGTYPAGTSGSSIFIGGVFPLTGPYSASGKDEQLGFQMAIDHLNNGSAITAQIPSLKSGGGTPRQEDRVGIGGFRNQAGHRGAGGDPLRPRQ